MSSSARGHIASVCLVLSCLSPLVVEKPAHAKASFIDAVCSFIGSPAVIAKVRGLYYQECVCTDVDKIIAKTGDALSLWTEVRKTDKEVTINCVETEVDDETGNVTYKNNPQTFPKYTVLGNEADPQCYKKGPTQTAPLCGAANLTFPFYAKIAKAGALQFSGTDNGDLRLDVSVAFGPFVAQVTRNDGGITDVQAVSNDAKWTYGLFQGDNDHTSGKTPPVTFVRGLGQGNYFAFIALVNAWSMSTEELLKNNYSGLSELPAKIYCDAKTVNVGYATLGEVTDDRMCKEQ